MKKYFALLLSSAALSAEATGFVNVSSSKSVSDTSDISLGVTFGVTEKLMRKTFYAGTIGYSTGVTPEYSLQEGTYLYTNHGIGYQFNESLRTALTFGVDYNSNRSSNESFKQKVSLNVSCILWE